MQWQPWNKFPQKVVFSITHSTCALIINFFFGNAPLYIKLLIAVWAKNSHNWNMSIHAGNDMKAGDLIVLPWLTECDVVCWWGAYQEKILALQRTLADAQQRELQFQQQQQQQKKALEAQRQQQQQQQQQQQHMIGGWVKGHELLMVWSFLDAEFGFWIFTLLFMRGMPQLKIICQTTGPSLMSAHILVNCYSGPGAAKATDSDAASAATADADAAAAATAAAATTAPAATGPHGQPGHQPAAQESAPQPTGKPSILTWSRLHIVCRPNTSL